MSAPHIGEQSHADLQAERDELRDQLVVDRLLIEALQAEGVADRGKIANLEAALVTARQIGMAMGILMERHQLTEDQAFDALRKASQQTNRKLRVLAETMVVTGRLPDGSDDMTVGAAPE